MRTLVSHWQKGYVPPRKSQTNKGSFNAYRHTALKFNNVQQLFRYRFIKYQIIHFLVLFPQILFEVEQQVLTVACRHTTIYKRIRDAQLCVSSFAMASLSKICWCLLFFEYNYFSPISVTAIGSSISLGNDDVRLISSPFWPNDYPASTIRTTVVRSPVGSSIKLVILDLSLESSCSYDTVGIYDGK